jgi:hypothetical protein
MLSRGEKSRLYNLGRHGKQGAALAVRAGSSRHRQAPQHVARAGENECGPGESGAHCAALRHSSLIMATPAMSMPTPPKRSADTGRIGKAEPAIAVDEHRCDLLPGDHSVDSEARRLAADRARAGIHAVRGRCAVARACAVRGRRAPRRHRRAGTELRRPDCHPASAGALSRRLWPLSCRSSKRPMR